MAIIKVEGYTTKPKAAPKITVPSGPVIGYTGSGWNYPSALPGVPRGAIVHYPTTPGASPTVINAGISSALPTFAPPPDSPQSPLGVQPAQAGVPKNWQDYLNEAMGTPQWAAANTNYNSLLAALRTQLKSGANAITANLGYDIGGQLAADPSLAALAGDLTPDAAAVAAGAANPLSAKAQIERQYQQGSLDALYAANARGTLGSGASTAAGNQLLQSSQLAANQAQQEALNAIRNAVSGYTTARENANQNLMSQQSQIMQALAASAGPVYNVGGETQEPATSNVPGTNISSPVTVPGQPGKGISWGGQTFTGVTALARYLAQHGVSYATWKNNHPAAAAKLEGGY